MKNGIPTIRKTGKAGINPIRTTAGAQPGLILKSATHVSWARFTNATNLEPNKHVDAY